MATRTRGDNGRWRRGIGLAGALAALTATVLVVPTPTRVAALTSSLSVTTVGHSELGTVQTSTTDFNYEGRLDLVDDDGTKLFSRTVPNDPTLQGVSRARHLSFCADTVTSLNGVYDQDTGTTAYSVIWYSMLGSRTASGTVDLAADESYLTSAPGGWVTTTSDTEAGTTELVYHGTDGSSRSLGTLAHTSAAEPVCDEESVVVTAATYPSTAEIVRIPFDGSGPVIVRTESLDADPTPWPRALSVEGDDVLGTVTPQQGWEPSPVGRIEVWRHDGTTTTSLVTAPEGSRVEGGAIGPDGVIVCLSHPDLSGGCDGRYLPTTGAPTQGELPESGQFWPVPGGFVQGCNGASGTCADLYRITTPDLVVTTLYRARQPLDIARWGGADRYAMAATISAESFSPGSLVFLASGTGFADALAVGAQGARIGAPTLLTTRDRMPAVTEAELRRLTPSRIWVVGGTGAVSDAVFRKATTLGTVVIRIGGADRYAVAAAVSRQFYPDGWDTAFVVSGEDYPDGLVAAPPAGQQEAPILLTRSGGLPAATVAELKRLSPNRIVVVGGSGAVGQSVVAALKTLTGSTGRVDRVFGSDRYRTATAVSRAFYPEQANAALATGANFPDALAMGSATRGQHPLLLTTRYSLPATTASEMQRLAPGWVRVAGGPAVVDGSVLTQVVRLPDIP